jgi:hypothetical protein
MAVVTYNRGADRIMECALSSTALDLRCALVIDAAAAIASIIDQDLDTVADVDAIADLSIHTERIALTSETSTQDDANNRANVDAADIVFAAAAGVDVHGAVVYDEGAGADATRHLVWGMSFAAAQPLDGGFTLAVADLVRVATATA